MGTGDKADERLKTADGGAPQKPYLTEAPAVIALFKQMHGFDKDGSKVDNYYMNESAGIAAGLLITALHVGLATLTSTPMGAEVKIREILGTTLKSCFCSCPSATSPRMPQCHTALPCGSLWMS